jgi:signal transduction histidine kinase/ActR/RegA family two-component response regulator
MRFIFKKSMESPIIKQIVLFGILTAFISLLLACVGFGIVEFHRLQKESASKLRSQIDVLAYNLESPLLFDDREAAQTILNSLKEDKSINKAFVYKSNGRLFAGFSHPDKRSNILLRKFIFYNHKEIGYVEMTSTYEGLAGRYFSYLLISLLIIGCSIPASYLISHPIRRQVSLGVLQLERQSERLRMLAAQVADTEQKERKRIAALIHDHLQQLLVASKLQLNLALKAVEKRDFDKATTYLGRMDEFINESTQAAKTLTIELRPPVLYEDGLPAAFQWLATKFKNEHDFDITLHLQEIPGTLTDNLKIMLFESARELLFNAVKYADAGAAELELKYEDNQILISIKDKGKGFDINQIERKTSSTKGFGIFSIRERLKLINGQLNITSIPGEGTNIEMIIPVEMELEQAPSPKVPARKIIEPRRIKSDKAIKVLLADDHKIVREGIANLLKENEMFNVVAQAENGVEAVEKAEAFLPDVIVMDVNMPKLNGIEATRIIKKRFPSIDIIGLSVQDEYDVAESMKKAGAVMLINKAGNSEELIENLILYGQKQHGLF